MRSFWLWIYIVGLAGFYLLVLFIIPLGARDLRRLLKELGKKEGGTATRHEKA
ncbi:MAG: hypothetical protein ABFR33_08480 [Verrucomicrobiota bacterium]